MARYKTIDTNPQFLAVDLARQLLPGTFEHTLISTLRDDIAPVFAAVLAVCDQRGLIGREMFAIDGVKLPSNASKHTSGTRADFARQAEKLEAAAVTMLQRHRVEDTGPGCPSV